MKFSADNPFARPKPANRIAKRLGLALLIAAMVHLAAIFSLDWELKQTPELSQSLDVTLVSFSSDTAAGTATADDDASDVGRPFMDDNNATPTTASDPVTASTDPAAAATPATNTDSPPPADSNEPTPSAAVVAPNAPATSTSTSTPPQSPAAAQAEPATPAKPKAAPKAAAKPEPEPEPEPEPKPQPKPVVKAQPDPTPKPQPKPKPKPKPQVQKPKPATSPPKAAAQPNAARKPLAFGRDQLSASLAGIQADNAFARQQPNQGSRVSRHHLATSKRDVSAWYRDAWRKKVERIGNLNYPEEARRQGLYGNLRMRVLINRDGSLQEMRILESSGHKALDQAALNIVRLSAPFAPFSNELAAQYEQVEIIRTWRFERGDRLSSQ